MASLLRHRSQLQTRHLVYKENILSTEKVCSVEGCAKEVLARQLCSPHYQQEPDQVVKKRTNYALHRPRSLDENLARNRKPRRRFGKFIPYANKRGLVVEITFEQFEEIIAKPCHYCGGKLAETGCGMDRKDHAKGYSLENILPCCRTCNRLRSNFLTVTEMEKVVRLIQQIRQTSDIWGTN